ncbi:hypothetical protein, partial [Komagataeibacter europaeus]|uniref:hypothetical protein n=1 Tax=Komagataeibacter europaeus TaxID=33995 RepID=UPI001E51A626
TTSLLHRVPQPDRLLGDCLKSQAGRHSAITKKFLVKLFSKSFEERRLFEKKGSTKRLYISHYKQAI